jgi:hypothetical protein
MSRLSFREGSTVADNYDHSSDDYRKSTAIPVTEIDQCTA